MGAVDKIKEALRTALPTLDTSAASIERKIIDVVGTYADSEAIERDNTLRVINEALANQKVTSIEYYRRKAVAYQEGDPIVFDPVNFGGYYEVIDTNKQLVKQACIVGMFPNYTLRVNKFDSTLNRLAPLMVEELAGFESYFALFQPLGLTLEVQSYEVARITDPNLVIYIYAGYDAEAIVAEVNQRLVDAQSVLRTTNKVTQTELVDLIQSVTGVRAVGFSPQLKAVDTDVSGNTQDVYLVNGVFELTTNAFVFGKSVDSEGNVLPFTSDMVKVLQ